MKLTEAQAAELFHLAFLDVLDASFKDAPCVLKGGANLRYFYDSVRYSEDIDLDTTGGESWILRDKVDAALAGGALEAILRANGIAVASATKPKQTETTQRWKVTLGITGTLHTVRTKIEFSRRNGETRIDSETVPSRIVSPYGLRAPFIRHYQADAATEQKVEALADRRETQARDVFDLDLLLRREPLKAGAVDEAIVAGAIERALELPFTAFRDQVLPFLEPAVSATYDSAERWEAMQLFVAGKLGGEE